jgi:protein required for attachment to host cells
MTASQHGQKRTWLLVADEGIARLLELPSDGGVLQPVEQLVDEDAHGRSAEFRRDAQGRRSGNMVGGTGGPGSAPVMGTASVTASAGEAEFHQEADNFARRVANLLLERHQQRRFDTLEVVAAPRFLGVLRQRFPTEIAKTVTRELSKDLTGLGEAELTQRLWPERSGPRRKLEPKAAEELRSGNVDIRH